jgi:hypothetical protein
MGYWLVASAREALGGFWPKYSVTAPALVHQPWASFQL